MIHGRLANYETDWSGIQRMTGPGPPRCLISLLFFLITPLIPLQVQSSGDSENRAAARREASHCESLWKKQARCLRRVDFRLGRGTTVIESYPRHLLTIGLSQAIW